MASGVLAIGLAACGGEASTTVEEAAAPGPATVEVVRVLEQPLDVTLAIPGEIHPYQAVAIYPRVTGFVKSIAVDRGSRVAAGDPIAVLDRQQDVEAYRINSAMTCEQFLYPLPDKCLGKYHGIE